MQHALLLATFALLVGCGKDPVPEQNTASNSALECDDETAAGSDDCKTPDAPPAFDPSEHPNIGKSCGDLGDLLCFDSALYCDAGMFGGGTCAQKPPDYPKD